MKTFVVNTKYTFSYIYILTLTNLILKLCEFQVSIQVNYFFLNTALFSSIIPLKFLLQFSIHPVHRIDFFKKTI